MMEIARRRHHLKPRRRLPVPIPKLSLDFRSKLLEIHIPRNAQNRIAGMIALLPIRLAQLHRQLLEVLGLPHRVAPVGRGEMPLTQFDHQLLSRLIINPRQCLKR
jgi:hypothetical protein